MRADVSWVRVVGGSLVWASLGICCFTSWRSPADVAVAQESTEKKQAERQPRPSEPDRKPEDVRRAPGDAAATAESRDESREKLEREISCDLQEVPLSDLLEFLSKAIGLPVHLDEVSVDGSNIDRDKTFTARLKRVRAATMLDLLLEPRDLQWSLEEGTIEVFSIADAKDHREASVIGFHDLMPNDLEDRLTIMGRVRDELPHLFESEGQTDESFLSVDSRGFAVVRANSHREQEHWERFFEASRRIASRTSQQLRDSRGDANLTASEYLSSSSAAHTQRMRQKLARRVDAQFVETPLRDVLQYLADAVDVSWICDDESLFADYFLDRPVTLDAKQWSVERVLRTVLRAQNARWSVVDQVIVICSAESHADMSVRLYPVADLLKADDMRFKIAHEVLIDENTLEFVVAHACGAKDEEDDGFAKYCLFPEWGVLAVRNSEEIHRRVEQFLSRLRATMKEMPDTPTVNYGRSYSLRRTSEGDLQIPIKEVEDFVRSRFPAGTFQGPRTSLRILGDRLFVEHDKLVHERVQGILVRELGVFESVSSSAPTTPTFRLPEGLGGGASGMGGMGGGRMGGMGQGGMGGGFF